MTLNAPSTAPNAIPPGWYADPSGPGTARWWSGQDWTHHVQPLPAPAPVAPPSTLLMPKAEGLATRSLVWGIVAVVFNVILAPSVLAIVYGAVALSNGKTLGGLGQAMPRRGFAIAGIVLGCTAVVLDVVFAALLVLLRSR